MINYSPSPTRIPLIRVVQDGDAPNEANFAAPVHDLADNIQHIIEGNVVFGGNPTVTGEFLISGPTRHASTTHFSQAPGWSFAGAADVDSGISETSRVTRISALSGGTRNYWVATTPSTDNMTGNPRQVIMRLIRPSGLTATTVNLRLTNAAGTVLAQFPNDASYAWAEVMYTGSGLGWRVIGCSSNTAALVQ